MGDVIVEDNNIITNEEKNEIKNFIDLIPFYWSKSSTSKKFPFYYHTLIKRPENDENFNFNEKIKINSKYFEFFYPIVERFCKKHNISYLSIIRACLNSTFYIPGYPYLDPHIDFSKKHLVLLIYLSDNLSSPTLIFNKTQKFDGKDSVLDVSLLKNKFLKVKKKVYPTLGKIICFDGKFYHSNKFPVPGENRIVCVFNLLI